MASKLTAQQEKFCQAIADGKNQADAYRASYNAAKQTDATIWANASRTAKDSKVLARVKELKDALTDKAIWTRLDSVTGLADIARDTEAKANEKVSAIKELNAMHGFNEPTKHELAVNFPKVINVISGRA